MRLRYTSGSGEKEKQAQGIFGNDFACAGCINNQDGKERVMKAIG